MGALILRATTYILSGIGINEIMDFFDDDTEKDSTSLLGGLSKLTIYVFILLVGVVVYLFVKRK